MGTKFNPLIFTGLDFTGSGSSNPTIGNPVVGGDADSVLIVDNSGNLADVPLSTGQLLIGRTSNTPIAATLTGTANQVIINSTSGAITLSLPQSIATTSSPSFANLSLSPSGVLDTTSVGTLAIGTANANVINIGSSGTTINLQGSTFYQNVTTLNVANKIINLNTGGSVGSGSTVGLDVQENAIVTGYINTSGDRNSWLFKAPNQVGIVTLSPGASGFTIDQGSHNPVTIGTANGLSLSTQILSLQLATTSLNGALSSTDWNTFNNKQPAGNYITALTGDVVASGPGSSSAIIQANVVSNAKLAQMAANTLKGNNTGSTANALDLSIAQVQTMLGTSGTNTGDVTLTAAGSSPNANSASLSGQALTLQPANGSFPGIVSTTTQTFAGNKTFSGTVAASNLSGTNTGDQTITLSGDISGSGTGAISTTLATVNGSPGTVGAASTSTIVTVNGKGLVTSVTTTGIQIAESQVTNLISDLASKANAVTGDISPTTFSGLANNTSNQTITGLTFATTVSTFEVLMNIQIIASSNTYSSIKIIGTRKASSDWSINSCQFDFSGDAILGLDFNITSAGQVRISVGNISGFSSASIKFRAQVLS